MERVVAYEFTHGLEVRTIPPFNLVGTPRPFKMSYKANPIPSSKLCPIDGDIHQLWETKPIGLIQHRVKTEREKVESVAAVISLHP